MAKKKSTCVNKSCQMHHGCDLAVEIPEPKHLWRGCQIKRKMCWRYIPKGRSRDDGTGKRQVLFLQKGKEEEPTLGLE